MGCLDAPQILQMLLQNIHRGSFTLKEAAPVATCIDPRCVVIANSPHHS